MKTKLIILALVCLALSLASGALPAEIPAPLPANELDTPSACFPSPPVYGRPAPLRPSIQTSPANLSPWTEDQALPAVAYNTTNHNYFVVWEDHYGGGNAHIVGRTLESDGAQGYPEEISYGGAHSNLAPDVAYNSYENEYLVVWEEVVSSSEHAILARLVAPSGAYIGEMKYVSLNSYERRPVVAYSAWWNQYLVVWEKRIGNEELGQYDIVAQRLNADANPVDGWVTLDAGLQNQFNPAVAYSRWSLMDVDQYLVIWQDYDAGNWDINGRFVQGNSGAISDERIITNLATGETEPDLIYFSGYELFLATWEARNQPDTDWDILGAYINMYGSPSPPPAPFSSAGASRRQYPAISYNPVNKNFLVAFQFEWGGSDQDIYYSLLDHYNQRIQQDYRLSYETSYEGRPATDSDRNFSYLVAWEDGRNWSTNGSDIYASFVTTPVLYLPLALR